MPPLALAVLVAAGLVLSPRCQRVRGGEHVVLDLATNSLLRVRGDGTVGMLHMGSPFQAPTGAAVDTNRDVLVVDFTAGTLFRLPNAGGIAPVATGLLGPIRVAVVPGGDAVVTELSLPGVTRITPAGVRTIVHQGAPFQRPFGIGVDSDGTFLVVDDQAKALFRVTPAGTVTTIHAGPPFLLPQGVCLLGNGDYAVLDGTADAVFVVPRGGGSPTTLVAPPVLGNPCGIVEDFEGGVSVSESSSTANRVVRIDPAGRLRVLAQGAPFASLEGLGHVPSLVGPARGRAGQAHTLDVDLPQHAGRVYALFASLSVHPGFALGGTDPRRTPCNPDGAFFLSFGSTSGVFAGFAGTLSSSGQATATITVPSVTLPPFTLFVQGFAVHYSSPGGIAELTNVHAIEF